MKYRITIFVFLVSAVLLSLGWHGLKPSEEKAAYSDKEAREWAEKTLEKLSIEEKAGQLVWEQMQGLYTADDTKEYQYIKKLIVEYGIGGFVLYGGTPHDTARLLNKMQKAAKIPLMISADFENGCGQQISGAVWFPGNMALGALKDEKLSYEMGKISALEGRAIGIHWTYSPVVDVNSNPENPVLSVRSFGEDVEWLSRLSAAQIRGFQDYGMLSTAKHYPGRGDVELIPETDFTINRKSIEQLNQVELFAFKKAIEAGVGAIMTEHIIVPAMEKSGELPASMSEEIIGWIRDKGGFEGIITSDDLWYEKITKNYGAEEACIRALKAGHDTILKPADAEKTIIALIEAVKKGELSEKKINDSVRRVLYWKAKLGLHKKRVVDLNEIDKIVGCKEHRDLNLKIAEDSLTLIKNEAVLPIKMDIKRLVHVSIKRNKNDLSPSEFSTKLKAAWPDVVSFELNPDTDADVSNKILKTLDESDIVIISLFVPRTRYVNIGKIREDYLNLIKKITKLKPKSTLVISFGNPYLIRFMEDAPCFLVGYAEKGFYGNQSIYMDAFINMLKGKCKPKGKLPITISETYPLGHGLTY
jgi:beta-N-acetylhexosaminidase